MSLPNCYRCGSQPCTCKDHITLYHADCREVLPLLEPGSVDLVLTDPPYGINLDKAGAGGSPSGRVKVDRFCQRGQAVIAGDKEPDGWWVAGVFLLLSEPGVLYSFSRWDVDREWHTAIETAGFDVRNRIVWAKSSTGSGDLAGAFAPNHETIWRAAKGRALLRGYRWPDVWRDGFSECVRHGKLHPFEKPIDLLGRAIESDSDRGQTVLDPFAGSGTTGRACKDLGRKCIMCEIEEKYCEIASNRLRQEVLF